MLSTECETSAVVVNMIRKNFEILGFKCDSLRGEKREREWNEEGKGERNRHLLVEH